ncbi:hypothetical protein Tco_1125284 [Tanacetum coccineum]|uniref:Antifreeze protein n=1 Tax=Tanacetum coccineum TaxID=301880 RepID=A0ABQ5J938_9ASTR
MPLLATMLPPAQAAIAGESSGEAAPSNPQIILCPETIMNLSLSWIIESTPTQTNNYDSSAPVMSRLAKCTATAAKLAMLSAVPTGGLIGADIPTAITELQSQNIRRSLKRPSADLEQASSKKSKPTKAPKSSIPDESQQPSAEVPSTATQQPSEFSS